MKYDIFERFLFSKKLYAVDIFQSYGPGLFVTHLKFSKYSISKSYGIESDQCWFYDILGQFHKWYLIEDCNINGDTDFKVYRFGVRETSH